MLEVHQEHRGRVRRCTLERQVRRWRGAAGLQSQLRGHWHGREPLQPFATERDVHELENLLFVLVLVLFAVSVSIVVGRRR
jgi:hypothetical protein